MTDPRCAWHAHDSPLDEPSCGCSYCGMLIATKDCEGCNRTFLDWGYGAGDDVISGPYVTSSGDLVCERCCGDDEDTEYEDDEANNFGDSDPYGDCAP